MIKITYIKTSKDEKLLLLGIVEEGESRCYTISQDVYSAIGSPLPHSEISEREMSIISYADELIRAEKKALSLLSYADNNERTLRSKLVRAGFSHEIASEICEKMISLGYINENRQLERLILNEANFKLRGPKKIAPLLVAKGYNASDVRLVMSELSLSGEIDFRKNAERLIEKRLPADATDEEKKKLLYRNGYEIC